jgi:hypothetical protein
MDGCRKSASTGFWSPDSLSRSESLHRLSYPGTIIMRILIITPTKSQELSPRQIHSQDSHMLHTMVRKCKREVVGLQVLWHVNVSMADSSLAVRALKIKTQWTLAQSTPVMSPSTVHTATWPCPDLLCTLQVLHCTVDPRVTTGLTYEQLGLRPKF